MPTREELHKLIDSMPQVCDLRGLKSSQYDVAAAIVTSDIAAILATKMTSFWHKSIVLKVLR